MHYFYRVLASLKSQLHLVILSIVCALLVALMFTLSIGAMLPLMKVMLGEEGLHGWIYRSIVTHRTGMAFAVISPDVLSQDTLTQAPTTDQPLRITGISTGKPADNGKLAGFDTILSVIADGAPSANASDNRVDLLEKIVRATAKIQLTIKHETGREEQVELALLPPPIYQSSALWFLSRISPQQTQETKIGYLKIIIAVILITTLLRCILRFYQEYLANRIAFTAINDLRNKAYASAIRLPLGFYSQEGISDTISRFVQDSNRIKVGIDTLVGKTILEPIKIIVLGYAAWNISPKMSSVIFIVAPFAAITLSQLGRKMKKATKKTLEEWSRLLGHLQGSLLGIRVVKGYHQENAEENKFRAINHKLLLRHFRFAKLDVAGGPLMEALGITGASFGMLFAASWIIEGNLRVSDFFTLLFLMGTMAESGRKLGDVWPKMQTANASAERIYQICDQATETDVPGAITLPRLSKSIEFRNLSFTYPRSLNKNLDAISFSVNAGQTIAVVGPNGSGKTTLLGMIPRFFIPEQGQVLIDGHDIARVTLASLRPQIGIVPQQPIVFNDTIASNIAYSTPGASMDSIISASRQAFAHEFIENTPNGYQTIIGEQGATLSGGQLQRIAIARAILRDPAILIFDEAMSQIDSESEQKIQQAIKQFSRGRTSFIIAHRLSTIIDAERIIVLDNGRLVDQGAHTELMKKCALYKQLYEMQFGGRL